MHFIGGFPHVRPRAPSRDQRYDSFHVNTHIIELSPEDWKLFFMHSGCEVMEEMTYRKYPELVA